MGGSRGAERGRWGVGGGGQIKDGRKRRRECGEREMERKKYSECVCGEDEEEPQLSSSAASVCFVQF